MAKLMLRPFNLLAMDEPTNHLDIPARETLEEALVEFDGTVILISHDRYFLDKVVNKILHLDPATGKIEAHVGNYSDWRQRLQQPAVVEPAVPVRGPGKAAAPVATKVAAPVVKAAAVPPADDKEQRKAEHAARKDRDRDVSRKQRRFAQVEVEIAKSEANLKLLREKLAAEHGGDWQQLNKLVSDEQDEDAKLQSLLAEWEKLGAELAE